VHYHRFQLFVACEFCKKKKWKRKPRLTARGYRFEASTMRLLQLDHLQDLQQPCIRLACLKVESTNQDSRRIQKAGETVLSWYDVCFKTRKGIAVAGADLGEGCKGCASPTPLEMKPSSFVFAFKIYLPYQFLSGAPPPKKNPGSAPRSGNVSHCRRRWIFTERDL